MSHISLQCPRCEESVELHLRDGEYKDYSGWDKVPVGHIKEIDELEVNCGSCNTSFTLIAKVVNEPVLKVGIVI